MSLGATGRSTIIARKPRRRGRIVTLDENELSSWTLKTVKRLKAQMKKDYVIWNSFPSSSFTILNPPSIKGHTN